MRIDRLLTVEQNGLRLAEKNYPAVIQSLWKDYLRDPSALERFVASRKGKGPAIEEIKDDSKGYAVDYREFDGGHDYFYWRGSLADGLVSLIGQKID